MKLGGIGNKWEGKYDTLGIKWRLLFPLSFWVWLWHEHNDRWQWDRRFSFLLFYSTLTFFLAGCDIYRSCLRISSTMGLYSSLPTLFLPPYATSCLSCHISECNNRDWLTAFFLFFCFGFWCTISNVICFNSMFLDSRLPWAVVKSGQGC